MQFVLENCIYWLFSGAVLKLDWKDSCHVKAKEDRSIGAC